MANLAHELHDLVRTLDAAAEQRLAPLQLTYRKYVALVIVGEHPGLTGAQLADALGVTPAATTGIARNLVERGLCENVSPAGAGNRLALRATPAGHQLTRRATAALGDELDDTVRRLGLDPNELAITVHRIHDAVRPTGQE